MRRTDWGKFVQAERSVGFVPMSEISIDRSNKRADAVETAAADRLPCHDGKPLFDEVGCRHARGYILVERDYEALHRLTLIMFDWIQTKRQQGGILSPLIGALKPLGLPP